MARSRSGLGRRTFLKSAVVTTLGAGLAWRFGGDLVLGQIPWEEHEDSLMLTDEAEGESPRLLGRGAMAGERESFAPVLAFNKAGVLWCACVGRRDGTNAEQVYAAPFADGKFGAEIQVSMSPTSRVHEPAITRWRDGVALVWAEQHRGRDWRLVLRTIDGGGALGEPVVLAEGGLHWRPAMASDAAGNVWVVWESAEKSGAPSRIKARVVFDTIDEGGKLGEVFAISESDAGDARRPAIAAAPDAGVWMAWDQLDHPGSINVYLARVESPANGSSMIRNLTPNSPAADVAPSLTIDHEGNPCVAWHSNRKGLLLVDWDIPRWFMLARFRDDNVEAPTNPPRDLHLDKTGQDQSVEFPRLFAAPGGGLLVTGRPSHNFCLQTYGAPGWSRRYRVPVDGWGGRGKRLEGVFDQAGDFWVIRRDLNAVVLHRIVGLGVVITPEFVVDPAAALRSPNDASIRIPNVVSNITRRPNAWEPLTEVEAVTEPLNFYYGDLHGHTWMSDGMGDVDEYFMIRRDYYEDDFAALTDHDTFVGKSLTASEFEFQKEIAQRFNADGKFATLFGQEYTTGRPPAGVGHKCVYATNIDVPLFDHALADYNSAKKLNAAARQWGCLVIPHHTGWTGTDWADADDDLQPLVEIVSNHGRFEFMGNRPIPHRGGMRGHFVQDALAMGRRIGIIGGSDNHGLIWHHKMARQRDSYRTGLACVLAPNLSRASVFEALRRRRCFGTTGIKPRLDFRVNGHVMGAEMAAPADGKVRIAAQVTAQHVIKWMTVVKNNAVWYEYGGEGYTSRFTIEDPEVGADGAFYYLRVEFEGEQMAWSSPIWVNSATA